MEKSKYLGTERIGKLLKKFSIPCILSLLISALYNIVDQIFIGNSELGYLGNAATSVVFPITIIAVAFAWCFGDGVAAFMSIRQGEKDTKEVHHAVGNSLVASGVISIVLAAVCFIFADKILFAFGASHATIDLARAYFFIIISAFPAYMLANTMSAIIRADGNPAFSMVVTVVGAVINLILDPLFIFGFGWGIEGVAVATIIGQIVSFIIATIYFRNPKTFKLRLKSFAPNRGLLSSVAKLGVSTFITQMSIVVISLVCNIMLARYGAMSIYGADIPIAVIGIAMKVFTIVINIVVGLVLGAQPILGYNFGAGNYKRVRETFGLVLKWVFGVGIFFTLIFQFCPQIIINIFGAEDGLYNEFATMTFRIFLSLVTFTCVIKVVSIFFQAVGKPAKSAIVSLARDLVFFVPLVLILPRFMGVTGALWAAPIADMIGIGVTGVLVVRFFRSLNGVPEKARGL
jgi:putative MATE family efflux protein